jgi:hypothetical protein
MNIQPKIYLTLVIWLGLCAGMFTYGFGILQGSNNSALATISEEKGMLLSLQAEQQSYHLAQKDLEDLAKKDIQPEDFFSKDVSLVKELTALENLGKTSQVSLSISGISGTIDTLGKANTQSELYNMNYMMSVTGSLANVMNFVQTLYNLNFVTTLNSMALGTVDKNNVSVNLTANFYIRK